MPRKKPPSDHTTGAIEAAIQAMKLPIIDPGFDLHGKIKDALGSYFSGLDLNPLLPEQRVSIDGMHADAMKLRERIENVGIDTQARLGVDLGGLEYDLLLLEARIKRELSGKKDKHNKLLQAFIVEVHAIYSEATGDKRKYTKRTNKITGAEEVTGLFFSFLKDLLLIIGIEKTDRALRNDIDHAFQNTC